MKKQLLILGILLAVIISGCSSETRSSHDSIVDGQWKLTRVTGSFAGVESNFVPGVITWSFNPTTQTVTVVNNNTNNNLTDIFETGVYNYQIVSSQNPDLCSEILKIDGMEMGCFSLAGNELKIDQSFSDGYALTLIP